MVRNLPEIKTVSMFQTAELLLAEHTVKRPEIPHPPTLPHDQGAVCA